MRLMEYIEARYALTEDGDQYIINLENNAQDILEINRDPFCNLTITINGNSFQLDCEEFQEFISSYRLSNTDPQDQLRVKYRGETLDTKRFADTHPDVPIGISFFLEVSSTFGFPWRLEPSTIEKNFFDSILNLTLSGRKLYSTRLIEDALPPYVLGLARNAIYICGASGTIIKLPNGGMGLLSADHVLSELKTEEKDGQVIIIIDGKAYSGRLIAPDIKLDLALIEFNEESSRELIANGYTGIPVTTFADYPEPAVIVATFGYPDRFIYQRGEEIIQRPRISISSGHLLSTPAAFRAHIGNPPQEIEDNDILFTSVPLAPGSSGSGYIWFNPRTKQFELFAVATQVEMHGFLDDDGMLHGDIISKGSVAFYERLKKILKK